jgi:hypothetical protein
MKDLLIESNKSDALKRLSQRFPEWKNVIQSVLDADPTNGRYAKWIEKTLPEVLTDDYNGNAIIEKYSKALSSFNNGINRISPKFMERFKNLQTYHMAIISDKDLDKILKSPRDIFSYDIFQLDLMADLLEKTKSERSKERKAKSETNFIYDDGNTIVVEAKSHKASCYYGANTKWCTTAENPSYFERYTSTGRLFYVIDRKNRREKVAVYVPTKQKNNVEVYDSADSLKNLDFLFRLYPEVEDTLDNIIGTSDTLLNLKKLKAGELMTRDTHEIDPLIYTAQYKSDDPKSIVLTLEFHGDRDFWNLFDDWDDYNKMIVDSLGSSYSNLELFDSYSDEQDWDEGYGFYWFDDKQIEQLQKLIPYFEPKLADCAKSLKDRSDDKCRAQVAEFLKTVFERKVDDIIGEHNGDRESDAIQAMKEELDKDYSNLFKEYGMPMESNNFYRAKVTLYGLLQLYKNFDPAGKLDIFNLLKTVIKEKGIDPPNFADYMYEYSSKDYEYLNTYNAIESLLSEMEDYYEEKKEAFHPEYEEYFNLVKKLGGVGRWFKMPGDERYSVKIDDFDAIDGAIKFLLQKGDGKIKTMRLPFENFKDFIYNQLLFDI